MAAWRGARGFESHDIVMPGTVTRACFLSIVITTALTHPRGRDRGTAAQKNLVNVPERSIYEVFCIGNRGNQPLRPGRRGVGASRVTNRLFKLNRYLAMVGMGRGAGLHSQSLMMA